MECVFGLVGNGFAIVAADRSAVHSILVHKSNRNKIMVLDSHKLIAASGEPGDRVRFTECIQKNVAQYQFRNGIPLTTAAAANFTRGELATVLRKWNVTGEAIDLVDKCILEIGSRLVVAPPNFDIKIFDKDGAREYAWRLSVKDTDTSAPPA